jgi:hypothetical protein
MSAVRPGDAEGGWVVNWRLVWSVAIGIAIGGVFISLDYAVYMATKLFFLSH